VFGDLKVTRPEEGFVHEPREPHEQKEDRTTENTDDTEALS
jgi:hypothetical protein